MIDLQKIPILAKKSHFEAHVDLGGYVNKQNCRIWGTEDPHAYIEKPTHPKRVTMWCGFWSRGIIGSFFCKVNGDHYRAMLNEFLFTRGGYWQHLVLTGRRYVPYSRSPVFEDRIISPRADVVWPPRRCDLTQLDYYLWGTVKDKYYADKPETIECS